MNDPMTTPQGTYHLTRFPEDPRDRLRAWDAADAYLLRHLAAAGVLEEAGGDSKGAGAASRTAFPAVVVLGDRWGALTTALAPHRPTQVTDSFLARQATLANLARAGVDPAAVRLLTTQDPPPDTIDVLLVRVPKSLALLEDQLHRLAPAVRPDTLVLGSGMVKEIHTSTLRTFERILGPTRTSLAEQKARLIHCAPEAHASRGRSPWPYRYALPDGIGVLSGRPVTNHAGVFCADRLDIGTRFFLRHLPGPAPGSVWWTWAAATGSWVPRWPSPNPAPTCCSWTSPTRRWPRPRRRTGRTPRARTAQAGRSSWSATVSRNSPRAGSTSC